MQIRLTCLFDTVNKNPCIDFQENHLPSIDYFNVFLFVQVYFYIICLLFGKLKKVKGLLFE